MAITRADVIAKIPAGRAKVPSNPTKEMLEYVSASGILAAAATFKDLLVILDDYSRNLFRAQGYSDAPSKDSLKNCHGKWSESIFAVKAWNALATINAKSDGCYVYVKLPTRDKNEEINKKKEWLSLLNENCAKAIRNFDLDKSSPIVAKSSHDRLTLIASNPDAVILKFSKKDIEGLELPIDPCKPISVMDVKTLDLLEEIYSYFYRKVPPSANLVFFISLKPSTRSDRRYQFLEEGNHVKSVLMYLYAMKADRGLTTDFFANRYFAICLSKSTGPDRKVMDSAMSAYVSAPIITPLWSVDKLYDIVFVSDIPTDLDDILKLAAI